MDTNALIVRIWHGTPNARSFIFGRKHIPIGVA
jgi:hypothetical protein